MTFNEYQAAAMKTAVYPRRWRNIVYPALGLAGEAGEAVEKVKKFYRRTGYTDSFLMNGEELDGLLKELGDVLWYVAALCQELGASMDWVASRNLQKLQKRQEDGTLKGEGDER